MILVLGALGQLGLELTQNLRTSLGAPSVIAADIRTPSNSFLAQGPFEKVDCCNPRDLNAIFEKYTIKQLYHLPALLSSKAEEDPVLAVDTNLMGLFQILELARQYRCQVFYPSTIGVFSAESPNLDTPQNCIMRPKTIYGTTKLAGELLCEYYQYKFQLDIRSIRLPGIISHQVCPQGGTTDYAVEMFYAAQKASYYTSYLEANTTLDMVYIEDAIVGILQLMEVDRSRLKGMVYNLTAMQFSVADLHKALLEYYPNFKLRFSIDPIRQRIAESWPKRIDDRWAREEWGWNPKYSFQEMVETMCIHLQAKSHV